MDVLSFIMTIHRCDRAARAVHKRCIKTITEKNIQIALIGYFERETFMNPLHTLFPFKGFQYPPASISLHRESDRNLSTTLIHEKIIQKNIFLIFFIGSRFDIFPWFALSVTHSIILVRNAARLPWLLSFIAF